jgi:hypothetical protein
MKRWDRKMVRHFRYVAVRESRLLAETQHKASLCGATV